jgi:hypothetical protein
MLSNFNISNITALVAGLSFVLVISSLLYYTSILVKLFLNFLKIKFK